ncbi:MAG: CHRD domain-containing protein [Novosphingobium sp.]
MIAFRNSARLWAASAAACCTLTAVAALAAPVKLVAVLTGAGETGGGEPKAVGGFKVEMDPETNDFCYSLWADKGIKPSMAHIHSGAAGSDGPPLATLEVTGKSSDSCLAIDKAKLQPIADNPALFYVNVHSAAFPNGALRGQLVKE